MRGRRLTFNLCPALLIAGKPQATIHLPASAKTGFRFQRLVELDRITQQLGDIRACAQLPHQTCSVKRCARRQLFALEQHCVFKAHFGEMVSGRAAYDTAADYDDLGSGWESFHDRCLSCSGNWQRPAHSGQGFRRCKRNSRNRSWNGFQTPCSTWFRAGETRISWQNNAARDRR